VRLSVQVKLLLGLTVLSSPTLALNSVFRVCLGKKDLFVEQDTP